MFDFYEMDGLFDEMFEKLGQSSTFSGTHLSAVTSC